MRMWGSRLSLALFSLVAILAGPSLFAQTKLLRFPDIHGDRIAFVYAGDIWTVGASGGRAVRVTAHPGVELFPKFSPDGSWIAFTGQYDGDEQVYVIPANGGVPRQLTFYPARGPLPPRWGYDNQIYGWTKDGKEILFRSMRDGWTLSDTRLYTVAIDGGLPKALPMPVSGAGDFSPDGSKVVYSPLTRDFRTWKRYQGGWAQDLYIFDLQNYELTQITDHLRTDRDPMWIGSTIYFASDRSGTLNLYSYDIASGQTQQLTDSNQWDVRWPSHGEAGKIVYELQGELHVFDTPTSRSSRVPISVPTDALATRSSRVSAKEEVEDFELSPKGERALFTARGDLFSAPVEKGFTRNLTDSSGAHDKWARWSPDGASIVFISDMDGEEELYLTDYDGSGEPEQLTDNGQAMRYRPVWAPDGERIAFSDKEGRIFVLTLDDRQVTEVADDPVGQALDYTWSPDGRYLAFSLEEASGFSSIYIWGVADGELYRITDEYFNEWNPAWDPEGKYLYYLSDREFAPQIGSFEWNYVVDRESYIYALALHKDVAHPFPPEDDEVTIAAEEEEEEEQEEDAEDKEQDADAENQQSRDRKEAPPAAPPLRIDFDGLAERVAQIPVPADNYQSLAARKGHLLYVRGTAFYYGRPAALKPALQIFSMEEREEANLAENVSGYALSQDGSKVLVRQENAFNLYDATLKGKDSRKAVSTDGLMVTRDPKQEWVQIFDEVWRRFRDFFYVENLHGYDWEALRDRYRTLLEHVGHRSDLNYLIGEMIAELNVSHAYIVGGDFEIPDRPDVGLPGARFELDESSGRYRISRIFEGQNEEERYRSPLTEIGLQASEGDYILAIDGEELTAEQNPYELLRFKGNRPVQLTLNDQPARDGAREITFDPITSETNLIYFNWVAENRSKVSELSNGRVGYLHIPDMGADGIREFIKWYYGQIRKEGLVIDVRANGGGNVSAMLIERLNRELLAAFFPRTGDYPETYPSTVFHGHMAAIINENSASDGDIFPAMFKQAGLGPLIGKRTWGGVVGITNRGPLIDGGSVFVPEFAFASADGEWIIEGHGVDPDIVVENDPKAAIQGRDPQLERTVQEILEAIEADPKKLPARPAPPVR